MKVSLVIPVYNEIDYLPQAVASASLQIGVDYELIIVDDGSTDGSREWLRAWQPIHEYKLIEQENAGCGAALNAGFAASRGEYRSWFGADDIRLPHSLQLLAKALDEHPEVGLVYASYQRMTAEGTLGYVHHRAPYVKGSFLQRPVVGMSFMYRTDVALQIGEYEPDLLNQDYDYWLRMEEVTDCLYIDELLGFYRDHPGTDTNTRKDLDCSGEVKARAMRRRGLLIQ